jgi:hypothetical protein
MFKAKKDKDPDIFQEVKIIDKVPKGYTETNEYFVDHSGWGKAGDPALTADAFLELVKAGRYYAVTDMGQFQLFVGEYEKEGE